MAKCPFSESIATDKKIYDELKIRISFPEKRWLLSCEDYADYQRRLRELAKKHKVKISGL
jgi:hypothetical protein